MVRVMSPHVTAKPSDDTGASRRVRGPDGAHLHRENCRPGDSGRVIHTTDSEFVAQMGQIGIDASTFVLLNRATTSRSQRRGARLDECQ